jgi:hypothetical protein
MELPNSASLIPTKYSRGCTYGPVTLQHSILKRYKKLASGNYSKKYLYDDRKTTVARSIYRQN